MIPTIWAHVTDNMCDNIIMLDLDTADSYPMDGLIEIDAVEPMPGIGWRYKDNIWTAPPQITLGADDYLISGTGASNIVYAWTGWPEDAPPTSVDFVVNDKAPQTVPLDSNNMASISVGIADANANNIINVTCMGMATMIMVKPS